MHHQVSLHGRANSPSGRREHVAGLLAKRSTRGARASNSFRLSTRGDEILDRSLQKIGGKGLFIKELEVAIEGQLADIAVHSMKDVPAEMPDGFCIAAVLERANPADSLVAGNGRRLDDLAQGARVGSSSLRRQAQLRMLRPDLVIEPLRGNVNTRLARQEAGDFDAIVLAAAGLERLGLDARISQLFEPDEMLPAAAQGVIGIESLEGNAALRELLGRLSHATTVQTTLAERTIAQVLQANCQSPVATFARVMDATLHITALVALPDGSRWLRNSTSGPADDAESLGAALAARLLDDGAADILEQAGAMDA